MISPCVYANLLQRVRGIDLEQAFNIFEFQEFPAFLTAASARLAPRLSAKRGCAGYLSRVLGYRSPRSIGMVLAGSRLPSKLMVDRLARKLLHTPSERRYLELLVEKEHRNRVGENITPLNQELLQLRPTPLSRHSIDIVGFSQIFQWYYFVLRQLVQIPAIDLDPEKLSQRLRKKVSPEKIKEALIRLCHFGYLEKQGNAYQVRHPDLITPADVPSQSLRLHHVQMLKRATEAIEEQPVEKREITSVTLRMRPEDLVEAKKRIRQFRDDFDAYFSKEEAGTEVYQLNLQLFSHTEEPL